MADISYGKKITHESYFDGKIKSHKTIYSIPVIVTDRSQVLDEILQCLNFIVKEKTDVMTIRIELDKRTKNFKLITREYETVEELSHNA